MITEASRPDRVKEYRASCDEAKWRKAFGLALDMEGGTRPHERRVLMGKRRTGPVCGHPYETLTITAGGGARGATQTIRVSCQECGARVAGNEGVVLFVVGMRDEMAKLRLAIRALGGSLPDPSIGATGTKGKRRSIDTKADCPHYLAWLDVAGEGRAPARGTRSTSTVKCRNCGMTWSDHTKLLMVLKKEIAALWLEVRRLGGNR